MGDYFVLQFSKAGLTLEQGYGTGILTYKSDRGIQNELLLLLHSVLLDKCCLFFMQMLIFISSVLCVQYTKYWNVPSFIESTFILKSITLCVKVN